MQSPILISPMPGMPLAEHSLAEPMDPESGAGEFSKLLLPDAAVPPDDSQVLPAQVIGLPVMVDLPKPEADQTAGDLTTASALVDGLQGVFISPDSLASKPVESESVTGTPVPAVQKDTAAGTQPGFRAIEQRIVSANWITVLPPADMAQGQSVAVADATPLDPVQLKPLDAVPPQPVEILTSESTLPMMGKAAVVVPEPMPDPAPEGVRNTAFPATPSHSLETVALTPDVPLPDSVDVPKAGGVDPVALASHGKEKRRFLAPNPHSVTPDSPQDPLPDVSAPLTKEVVAERPPDDPLPAPPLAPEVADAPNVAQTIRPAVPVTVQMPVLLPTGFILRFEPDAMARHIDSPVLPNMAPAIALPLAKGLKPGPDGPFLLPAQLALSMAEDAKAAPDLAALPVLHPHNSAAPVVHLPHPADRTLSATLPALTAHIADSLARNPDGTTTLTLSPEELGRVRVSFQSDRQDMIVLLNFDRPETLDLFRRHADQLAEVLKAAGYAGVQIGFGSAGAGGSGQKPDEDTEAGAESLALAPVTGAAPASTPRPMTGLGQLDLRL